MFTELPICELKDKCFARANNKCLILSEVDEKWKKTGCPFRKEQRERSKKDDDIIKLYRCSHSISEIARITKRPEDYVCGVIEIAIMDGIILRRGADRCRSRQKIERVVDLVMGGMSYADAGRKLGIPSGTIQNWRRKGLV